MSVKDLLASAHDRFLDVSPSLPEGVSVVGDPPSVPADPIVHLSDWAQQPHVHYLCGRWMAPAWTRDPVSLPELTYRGDDGDLYTFTRVTAVTCPECRQTLARNGTDVMITSGSQ
jgi:hypothetical protein